MNILDGNELETMIYAINLEWRHLRRSLFNTGGWFGHLQRKPQQAPVRTGMISCVVNTKRGRGQPELIWEEAVKRDLKE